MPRRFVFADESGDAQFTRGPNISRYFIVCTVLLDDCSVAEDLLTLRRELAWKRAPIGDYFHATSDKQEIRDAVFKVIGDHNFTIQATIMEKSKAQPQVRITHERFYKYGWLYHFRYGIVRKIRPRDELLITTCSCDPCLQVADYCTWAIQRKWERNDARSYNLIKDRIVYEFDLWRHGRTHYY